MGSDAWVKQAPAQMIAWRRRMSMPLRGHSGATTQDAGAEVVKMMLQGHTKAARQAQ